MVGTENFLDRIHMNIDSPTSGKFVVSWKTTHITCFDIFKSSTVEKQCKNVVDVVNDVSDTIQMTFRGESCGVDSFASKILERAKLPFATTHQEKIDELNMKYGGAVEANKACHEKRKGQKRSVETCAKISEANKGQKRSAETCAKISEANKGQKHTEVTKAKISEANKGQKHSAEHCAKISEANKGQKHSVETCAKISKAKKGQKRSAETCAKISEAKKGQKHTEKTKSKMSEARRARSVPKRQNPKSARR
jgi:hypothetical protein